MLARKKIEEMDSLMLEIINQQKEKIIDINKIKYNNNEIIDKFKIKELKLNNV